LTFNLIDNSIVQDTIFSTQALFIDISGPSPVDGLRQECDLNFKL